MKLEAGDKAGAQADWEAVLKKAPGSDAAQSARARLEAMGIKAPG
jgi:TolA-binding protein